MLMQSSTRHALERRQGPIYMKKALIGLAALSFIAGSASAAKRLNDLQLDTV